MNFFLGWNANLKTKSVYLVNSMYPRSFKFTHDLFKKFAKNFEIRIKQVIIHKLIDGIFYSSIICERDSIEEILDARTSDAIALALRFDSPIYTYDKILEKAGT